MAPSPLILSLTSKPNYSGTQSSHTKPVSFFISLGLHVRQSLCADLPRPQGLHNQSHLISSSGRRKLKRQSWRKKECCFIVRHPGAITLYFRRVCFEVTHFVQFVMPFFFFLNLGTSQVWLCVCARISWVGGWVIHHVASDWAKGMDFYIPTYFFLLVLARERQEKWSFSRP